MAVILSKKFLPAFGCAKRLCGFAPHIFLFSVSNCTNFCFCSAGLFLIIIPDPFPCPYTFPQKYNGASLCTTAWLFIVHCERQAIVTNINNLHIITGFDFPVISLFVMCAKKVCSQVQRRMNGVNLTSTPSFKQIYNSTTECLPGGYMFFLHPPKILHFVPSFPLINSIVPKILTKHSPSNDNKDNPRSQKIIQK